MPRRDHHRSSSTRPRLYLLLTTLLAAVSLPMHADSLLAGLPPADRALQEGRVGDLTALLRPWIARYASDAHAHLLLCRAFYAQDSADPAIAECEAAAANAPSSSEIQLWLGRSYGMKASSASPLSAFSLARKVHRAFERAVRLDANNLAATSDLGEFYVAAPGIVGGGADKARSLAATLHQRNQPQAESQSHRILALLAEKDKDEATAQSEFRLAASAPPPSAARAGLRVPGPSAAAGDGPPSIDSADWISAAWIDLGAFYAHHHQVNQAVSAVHTGIALDHDRGPNLVDAASVLAEAGRDLDLARSLLREYLASNARSDAAPAFKVHLQLGELLTRSGDLAAAHREYAAALALAPDFAPARNLAAAPPGSASVSNSRMSNIQ